MPGLRETGSLRLPHQFYSFGISTFFVIESWRRNRKRKSGSGWRSPGSGLTLSGIAIPQNSPLHGIAAPAGSNGRVNGWPWGGQSMRIIHSDSVIPVSMSDERRQKERYAIDCPIEVLTPGRGRKRMIGRGWLHDISENGARFLLDQPIEVGRRISLEVAFQNPDGEVTAIRFPGTVKRVNAGASHEVAMSFSKGGSFVRQKSSRGRNKDSRWSRLTKGSTWIN
jgi:PilZ domain